MHRLLELSTPSAHVAVPGPVEPAIVSYYLELIGIGAGDRIVVTVDGAPTEPAPAVVSLQRPAGGAGSARGRGCRPWPPRSVCGSATIAPCRCCPRTTASPGGGTRLSSGSSYIDELYRYGARTGARLAARGGSGRSRSTSPSTRTVTPPRSARAPSRKSTRTPRCSPCARTPSAPARSSASTADWREAVAALRATGSAWNPLARAGVVLYGLETLAETGELSVVALGNARTESEQCYEAALTALGAVQAATTLRRGRVVVEGPRRAARHALDVGRGRRRRVRTDVVREHAEHLRVVARHAAWLERLRSTRRAAGRRTGSRGRSRPRSSPPPARSSAPPGLTSAYSAPACSSGASSVAAATSAMSSAWTNASAPSPAGATMTPSATIAGAKKYSSKSCMNQPGRRMCG